MSHLRLVEPLPSKHRMCEVPSRRTLRAEEMEHFKWFCLGAAKRQEDRGDHEFAASWRDQAADCDETIAKLRA